MSEIKILYHFPDLRARYIVLNTMTSGSVITEDNMIGMGAIEIRNGFQTGLKYEAYFRPRTNISTLIESIHLHNTQFYNQSYENVNESELLVLRSFIEFIGESLIVAFNAQFHRRFLNKELLRNGLIELPADRFICVMNAFRVVYKKLDPLVKYNISLTRCCDYFKIKINPGELLFQSVMEYADKCSRITCIIMKESLSREKTALYNKQLLNDHLLKIEEKNLCQKCEMALNDINADEFSVCIDESCRNSNLEASKKSKAKKLKVQNLNNKPEQPKKKIRAIFKVDKK